THTYRDTNTHTETHTHTHTHRDTHTHIHTPHRSHHLLSRRYMPYYPVCVCVCIYHSIHGLAQVQLLLDRTPLLIGRVETACVCCRMCVCVFALVMIVLIFRTVPPGGREQCPELRDATRVQSGDLWLEETLPLLLLAPPEDPHPGHPPPHHLSAHGHAL